MGKCSDLIFLWPHDLITTKILPALTVYVPEILLLGREGSLEIGILKMILSASK